MQHKFKLSLIATSCLVAIGSVQAFKPGTPDHGHTRITAGVSYGIDKDHKNYEYNGKTIAKFTTKLSDGEEVEYSKEASDRIVKGVQSNDNTRVDIFNPIMHCDDEMVAECGNQIRAFRAEAADLAVKSINESNPESSIKDARFKIGKALHILQDFYAHSNFSDVNSGDVFYSPLTSGGAASFASTVDVCKARFPTAEWILFPKFSNNGGNWELTGPALTGGGNYTTGYADLPKTWGAGFESAPDTNGSKCDHGNEAGALFTGFSVVSGIAKDAPYAPLTNVSPNKAAINPIHVRAMNQAALHSKEFLKTVIDEIKSKESDPKKQDAAISNLLGVPPLIGFVVDTTGSMGPIINGVKTNIQTMIDNSTSTEATAKRRFLVEAFNDPIVGIPSIGKAAEAKTAVSALSASGGGDCPEMSQGGILAALNKSPIGSKLFVFTDASAKDPGLAGQVQALAVEKKVSVTYAISGSCSPIDPVYYQVAQATGGQVYEIPHTAAGVNSVFTSINIDDLGITTQPALIEEGELTGDKFVEFNVENGATNLSIIANIDGSNVKFYDPKGIEVTPNANQTINNFLNGKGLKVKNPMQGKWTVQLKSATKTKYSVKAEVANALKLDDLQFTSLTEVGRSGHESYTAYEMPPVGINRVQVTINNSQPDPLLELIDLSGKVLASSTLKLENSDVYSAQINVPNQIFRVRISGKTTDGVAYTRVIAVPYTAKAFALDFEVEPTLFAGVSSYVRAKITNYGDEDTFNLKANLLDATVNIKPASITLKKGESRLVELDIAVSPSAKLNSPYVLTIEGKNKAAVTEKLEHVFKLQADTDGDGVPDSMEMGMIGNDATYDGNKDGTPDFKQSNVISIYSNKHYAYVTYAVDAGVKLKLTDTPNTSYMQSDNFPIDLYSLKISNLPASVTSGGTLALKMYTPVKFNISAYAMQGITPDNKAVHVYDFKTDPATNPIGATFNGNIVTINLADGQKGDNDIAKNGEITHIGGPYAIKAANVLPPASPPPSGGPTTTPPAGDNDGGGCTMGSTKNPDYILAILAALSGLTLFMRRRGSKSKIK